MHKNTIRMLMSSKRTPLCAAAAAAVKATMPVLRAAGFTIKDSTFKNRTFTPAKQVAMMWVVLKNCVFPAEHRFRAHSGGGGGSGDIPLALAKIDVRFHWDKPVNASVLEPLITNYPVLKIAYNDFDESAALGAFAALATHLQELSFSNCGLTSLQSLEGRSEYLRKVNLWACKHITNIDALANRMYLEEVIASRTAIASLEPLRSCKNLTKVHVHYCLELSSIDALAGHQRVQDVDVSTTPITSIEPLRSCPNLTKVDLHYCNLLSSIDALAGHQRVKEVNARDTCITSIEPLRSCPNLMTVNVSSCLQLSSINALAGHRRLKEVDASLNTLTSVESLRSCPNLTKLVLFGCERLPKNVRMPASVTVIRKY